jgi:hypothetical protein
MIENDEEIEIPNFVMIKKVPESYELDCKKSGIIFDKEGILPFKDPPENSLIIE